MIRSDFRRDFDPLADPRPDAGDDAPLFGVVTPTLHGTIVNFPVDGLSPTRSAAGISWPPSSSSATLAGLADAGRFCGFGSAVLVSLDDDDELDVEHADVSLSTLSSHTFSSITRTESGSMT
jgi:hypothetical protein